MRKYAILLILLATAFPSFSQLGIPAGPALKIFLLKDSIAGEQIEINDKIAARTQGKLLVEADPNDVRKEIYDRELLIEVIHARNTSALARISLTGLKDFERNDVLKTLRPTLQPGDRIVLTFKMLADSKPILVKIIPVQ